MIFPDQLRRDALSCYGDPNVSTPHIDRLANNGVVFDAACSTSPVCVPFRYSLQTGKFMHQGQVPCISYTMPSDERTLADLLNPTHHTVWVGKWHLAGCKHNDPVPVAAQGRWQKWIGFELINNHFNSFYFEDDAQTATPINGYQTDGLFQRGIDYLRNERPQDKPFCCALSVEPPHFPYEAPETYMQRWRDRAIKTPPTFQAPPNYHIMRSSWPTDAADTTASKLEQLRTYYAMIENLDDNIGRLLDFLEAEGLSDSTTIMLFADHGEHGGTHALPTGVKTSPYETSCGIPLIVSVPGNAHNGQRIADPVQTEDLFPTILSLSGVPNPNDRPGMDLTPLINGQAKCLERDGILLEIYYEHRKNAMAYQHAYRSIRTQEWKYTVWENNGHNESWHLFNLKQDPHEAQNLLVADTIPAIAHDLHEQLRQLLIDTDDQFQLAAEPNLVPAC